MANYTDWSIDKLAKEIDKIERVIKVKKTRDKKAALAKLVSVARKSGFELHELVGSGAIKLQKPPAKASRKIVKKRGKVAPKYENPANTSQTWTGRGRQPLWVKEVLANGGSLEDIVISS